MRQLTAVAQRVQENDEPASQDQLRAAIDAARSVGVGWNTIGDVLGIARGNAYQRYRRRDDSSEGVAGPSDDDAGQRRDAGGPPA